MLHNLKTLLKAPVQKSMQNKNRRLHVEPFCFSDVFQLSRGTNEPTTPDTNARSGFSEALDCSGVDLVFEGGTDRLRLLTMSLEI